MLRRMSREQQIGRFSTQRARRWVGLCISFRPVVGTSCRSCLDPGLKRPRPRESGTSDSDSLGGGVAPYGRHGSGLQLLIDIATTQRESSCGPKRRRRGARSRALGRGWRERIIACAAWGRLLAVNGLVQSQLMAERRHRAAQLGRDLARRLTGVGAVGDDHPLVLAEVARRLDAGRLPGDDRFHEPRDPVVGDRPAVFHQWPVLRSTPSRRHASETETPCPIKRAYSTRFSVIG